MCGGNAECYTSLQDIETRKYGEGGCDQLKCSFEKVFSTCKRQRGPEVCEKITQYYNPLYLERQIDDSSSTPTTPDFTCDDEKGKYVGTYQCLGNNLEFGHIYWYRYYAHILVPKLHHLPS